MVRIIVLTFFVIVILLLSFSEAQENVDNGHIELTEQVLESDYFYEYMGRIEDQYSDFIVWFPAKRLDVATTLSFIEYQDGVVFVCFSKATDYIDTKNADISIVIAGPAVVFPVFPDGKRSKFKHNRYVGVKKEADWSKRDRHFWDEGIKITFTHMTGGHKRIVRVMRYTITDKLIGKENLDENGQDLRMTDRHTLARLMGKYFF